MLSSIALEQEHLAHTRTNTQREAAEALSTERQHLRDEAMAEQREWETLQAMMTSRLAGKDALIATLQRQIAEPPDDPGKPVENDTGGA